ncbi:hypothetical protein [Corynebacterium hindlerae]|uniref:hypothetical protein n=1 Tax=Corynebacterium hindlerae TaxID=699041 RepID=UPI003AB07CA2
MGPVRAHLRPWSWSLLVPVSASSVAMKLQLLSTTGVFVSAIVSVVFLLAYLYAQNPARAVFDVYRAPEEYPVPWGRVIFPPAAVVCGAIGLPDTAASDALLLTAGTAAGTLSMHTLFSRDLREQRLRLRTLASRTEISELTTTRLTALDEHRDLAHTLATMGAFDGTRVRVSSVSPDYEAVLSAGSALERHGLARISPMMHADDRSKWWIELTALGVQALASRR